MALKITTECTCCDACLLECPNSAITAGSKLYMINPALCTECVGFFATARCVEVCPVQCCVPDENFVETMEALLEKARAIRPQRDLSSDEPANH